MAKYSVTNQHSVPRSYPSKQNGQRIKYAPGEQKEVATKPPRGQGLWLVEVVEETVKPEDTELKEEDGSEEDINGGDN